MIPQRVERLADEVLQAALKVAHLERTASLAHLVRESIIQMRPICFSGDTTIGVNKNDQHRIACMKRAQREICEQIDDEKDVAKTAYDDAVEKFKSFIRSLDDTD